MKHSRCECGQLKGFGSMSPARCIGCSDCGTIAAEYPELRKPPEPHKFTTEQVDTDEGEKPRTYCRMCGRSKRQIEASEAANA